MLTYKFKPITNSLRHQINLQKYLLFKSNNLIKTLMKGIKLHFGRSTINGRITVRHKGGKNFSTKYRIINNLNNFFYSIIIGLIYDSQRNTFLSLNFNFLKKSFFYNLGILNVYTGSLSSYTLNIKSFKLGSTYLLSQIPMGSFINNISLSNLKKKSSIYIKSAGTYGILYQKSYLYNIIKFPSKNFIKFPLSLNYSRATLGIIANLNYKSLVLGKAGKNRNKGIRPSVRGIAMNPVDHPHGGRTNGGCHFVTPWGINTKGKKTVQLKTSIINL